MARPKAPIRVLLYDIDPRLFGILVFPRPIDARDLHWLRSNWPTALDSPRPLNRCVVVRPTRPRTTHEALEQLIRQIMGQRPCTFEEEWRTDPTPLDAVLALALSWV